MKNVILFFILTRGNKDKPVKVKKIISSPEKTETESVEQSTNETYICPMHPEVVRDRKGKCPKCGGALILKEE